MRMFFYGLLAEGMDNSAITPIRPRLGPPRAATTRGTLHAIPERGGWYPALLSEGDAAVAGVLYAPGPEFTAKDLARLDAYEAFDPGDLPSSEYVRREIEVTTADGVTVSAEAYVYNRRLPPGARPIEQDSFAAFLAAHDLSPLAPRDP